MSLAIKTTSISEQLSSDEVRRYARQLVLKGVGGAGQQLIRASRVLVIGAGGLGSPVLAYLAAAGVGTLGVVDDDAVAISNLQRQIIHTTRRTGERKASSAAAFVEQLNPHVRVVDYCERADQKSLDRLLPQYDFVVDGTDNFVSRSVIAVAARSAGKTLVTGAVSGWDGQLTVFSSDGPKFDDLYPPNAGEDDFPSCEMVGVVGAITGVIGSLMAAEVIKLLTGVGDPLVGRLLLYDGRSGRFIELAYGPTT